MSREPRDVTIKEIEKTFDLASYWFGQKWCPAVDRRSEGGYHIRVVKSETRTGSNVTSSYDYFYLGDDGTITTAPRGYAKDFKPGRVVDIKVAVERFAEPREDAVRINIGGRW